MTDVFVPPHRPRPEFGGSILAGLATQRAARRRPLRSASRRAAAHTAAHPRPAAPAAAWSSATTMSPAAVASRCRSISPAKGGSPWRRKPCTCATTSAFVSTVRRALASANRGSKSNGTIEGGCFVDPNRASVERRVDVRRIRDRGPAEAGHYPVKNDGSRMSRIVRNPGGAIITAGIELTVIEAVAMSPCTPPSIFE